MARSHKVRAFIKWLGASLLVVVVGGLIVYGPGLVGLLKTSSEIDRIARESEVAEGRWPRLTDTCVLCHGYRGNARDQRYPRLAGEPEAYLLAQLRAFAAGTRRYPNMNASTINLSDDQIRALAANYAHQRPLPNVTFRPDAAAVVRGKARVDALGCTSCHGANLMGAGAAPRLAGQGRDYLVRQLALFKTGERQDPTRSMSTIEQSISEQDFPDIAEYLASAAVTPEDSKQSNVRDVGDEREASHK